MQPLGVGIIHALLPGGAPISFAEEESAFGRLRDVTLAAQVADLSTYLPGCLTTKVDIASMAHSLETRAPFLHHHLVELGLALPRSERVRLRSTKVLLRKIATSNLGQAVARRPKRGFAIPLEVWLRGSMRAQARDYLLGPRARLGAIVNVSAVAHGIERFFAGERSLHAGVWTLLALEAWLRSPLGLRAVT